MGILHMHTTIDYKRLIGLQAGSTSMKINKNSKNGKVSGSMQENYQAKVRKLGNLGTNGRRI